ncbi:MAG: CTP synthase, partial [Bacteroidales bacterium]|nr:CTP synthase [Bacteroidales bacterium]
GQTVQVIPHITDEIKHRIRLLEHRHNYDFVITEIGGTVGDIEGLPFIEAMRQLKLELKSKVLCMHLAYVPYLAAAGELKSKPMQHSVKLLLEQGIQPEIIICRTEHKISESVRSKIAASSNIEKDCVIESIDAKSIYEVPLLMHKEGLDIQVLKKFGLQTKHHPINLTKWEEFVEKMYNPMQTVNIGLIGKYVELKDAYKSISEAFIHAGAVMRCKVNLKYIKAENVNPKTVASLIEGLNGVVVAPGFGKRGIEGKIAAIKYVRQNNIPFLGICLGMQCAVVEFARNVLKMKNAASTEMNDSTPYPVISLMSNQKNVSGLGGTMRLGAYPCTLKAKSLAKNIYRQKDIVERHRHRYEFNNEYLNLFERAGMKATGNNPQTGLVEVIEVSKNDFFVGVQFHPEYHSTVDNPHPLFIALVKAAMKK